MQELWFKSTRTMILTCIILALCPFWNISKKSFRSVTLNTVYDILMKLYTNISWGNMQSAWTIALACISFELLPFEHCWYQFLLSNLKTVQNNLVTLPVGSQVSDRCLLGYLFLWSPFLVRHFFLNCPFCIPTVFQSLGYVFYLLLFVLPWRPRNTCLPGSSLHSVYATVVDGNKTADFFCMSFLTVHKQFLWAVFFSDNESVHEMFMSILHFFVFIPLAYEV